MSTENEQIFVMNNTFYNAADNKIMKEVRVIEMEQAANKNIEDTAVEDTDGQWITPKKKKIVNQARNLPTKTKKKNK